ncbi:ribokinase [Actinomadura scrupuli]|uniref:ribokinase n=1 Tax=Actinomadura scrupuli TaxID=559629 RepID=UPI003D971CAE
MSRRPGIAVVGSLNVDLTLRCDHLPHPGETITGRNLTQSPGGKGANQALAAARLGAEVRMVGRTGADAYAEVALGNLRAAGVDLTLVGQADSPTGIAMILVDDTGENQIAVHPGANALLDLDDLDIGDADAVICQLEIPGGAVAQAAQATRGLFCLNAAPALPVPPEALARADVIVVNETEHAALPPTSAMIALTLGAAGAVLLKDGEQLARAAAPAVTAVNTVGAGDTFVAAFVVGLVEGRRPGDALQRACVAAALTVTREGAQTAMPTAAQVDDWRVT